MSNLNGVEVLVIDGEKASCYELPSVVEPLSLCPSFSSSIRREGIVSPLLNLLHLCAQEHINDMVKANRKAAVLLHSKYARDHFLRGLRYIDLLPRSEAIIA